MTLRLFVDVAEPVRVRAVWALSVLFEGIGVPVRDAVSASEAEVVYASEKPAGDVVWLQATRDRDWDGGAIALARLDTVPVIVAKDDPTPDIVRSAYAYLTGVPERLASRDWAGRPISDSNYREFGLHRIPVIAHYAECLERRLPPGERIPRWPHGKRRAVVLSHDVDAPFSGILPSYAWNRVRDFARRGEWRHVPRALGSFGKAALRYRTDPRRDPNLRFDAWVDFADSIGAQQTFYVAVRSAADRHAHARDVSYDFRHPALLGSLHRAAERGAEIGLHASIHAKRAPERMAEEREWLRDALGGYDIRGLRHHFWAVDPELPERTSWLHASAGFTYDSSFGLNDAPGFRRGMAWPFDPFDRERGERVPLLQVPPTLMDGNIFYRDVTPEEGQAEIRAHFGDVFSSGGAVVLDWHMEQMNPGRLRNAGPLLAEVLRELAIDNDIWWPSAAQLAAWWLERRQRLAGHS